MNKLFIILSIIIASVCLAKEKTEFNKIANQYFKESIESNPDYAVSLGIPDGLGYNLHKDKISDQSPKFYKQYFDRAKKFKLLIMKIDEKTISDEDRVCYEMFKWDIDAQIEMEKFAYHSYIITSFFNFHSQLISILTEYHLIENKNDVENYIKKLNMVENRFEQYHELLDIRAEKGIYPPNFIADVVKGNLTDFIGEKEVDKCIFYTNLENKIKEIDISVSDKEKYLDQAKAIMLNNIYPAYEKMVTRIDKIRELSDDKAGVWKLPDGNEYYQSRLISHTTTYLTPEEIHQLGIKEVKRIQGEMLALFAELGLTGENFAEIEGNWWHSIKSEENTYPNDEEGKNQAVDDYTKIIDEAKEKLPDYFSLLPKAEVIVKRVPDYKVSGAGAYYDTPSFDGKRPGIFYIDMKYPPRKPGMRSLTYHEAIPGHHLQLSIQNEIEYLKFFRSIFYNTGFMEGWALYAEKLANEEGWHKNVNSKLSYLNSELFRAVRLMLDTGIHYKRWSREKAKKVMKENLGWASISEINRYCVNPGQACSYKIGELKILELREKTKKELKDKFDIKEFHTLILEEGNIPLFILEKKINNFLASKKKL